MWFVRAMLPVVVHHIIHDTFMSKSVLYFQIKDLMIFPCFSVKKDRILDNQLKFILYIFLLYALLYILCYVKKLRNGGFC